MIRWIKDHIPEAVILAVIISLISIVIISAIQNHRLNSEMIGKNRAELLEQFGPPTSIQSEHDESEFIEWRVHHEGYFSSNYTPDGRGGGYYVQQWNPPYDVVRWAVIKRNRVVKCEGGF